MRDCHPETDKRTERIKIKTLGPNTEINKKPYSPSSNKRKHDYEPEVGIAEQIVDNGDDTRRIQSIHLV